MSESQILDDTQTLNPSKDFGNVLSWKGSDPYWELLGQRLILPLVAEEQRRNVKVFFELTNFSSSESEQARLDSAVPSKMEGDEMITNRGKRSPLIEFVDKHFVCLHGVKERDPEQHKAFLAERPFYKVRLWREAISLVPITCPTTEDEDEIDLISLVMSDTREYQLHPTLVELDGLREVKMTLSHTLERERQADYTAFENATGGGRFNTRLREWRTNIDISKLRAIYVRLAKSAEGYLIGGQPCVESNKEEWAEQIPLEHMLVVVDELFSGVRAKNV